MSPSGFAAVQQVLDAVRELEPELREARLPALCGHDEALLAEVRSLLPHSERPDERLVQAAAPEGLLGSLADRARDEADIHAGRLAPGTTLGAYTLGRLLGDGGMGSVYEARRQDLPGTVALKTLRHGAASPEVLRRFQHEAGVLRRMDHPGIVSILEVFSASELPGAPPCLVMELVEGQPLTEAADSAGLDTRARVTLMIELCQIVQHAHEQGVVHRDLKPANILVTADGRPQVLDFGVARVLSPDTLLETQHTATGQLLGTLQWMSPEQLDGRLGEADARSDVYALGLLLHQLLAGRPPYDLRSCSLPEAIQQVMAARPASWSLPGGADPGSLGTIVQRALRKQPERRYPSALALADDLERWRSGVPVRARPPTSVEQFARLVRLHRGLFVGLTVAFGALLLGLVLALVQADRARQALRLGRIHEARALQAAGVAALQAGSPLSAWEHLQAVPRDQRGWEWHHALDTFDGSLARWTLDRQLADWALGPGPRQLLTVDQEGQLILRSLTSGARLTDPALDLPPLERISLAPDGRRLAGWLSDPKPQLVLWDTLSAVILASLTVDDPSPSVVAWSNDGEQLAWCDGTALHWWHPGQGEPALAISTRERCADLALGRDTLAVTSTHGSVEVWDRVDGSATKRWATRIPRSTRGVLALSRDGALLAHGSTRNRITVLDATNKATVATMEGHTGSIRDLAWTADDERLLSAGADGTLRLWNRSTWQQARLLSGHTGRIRALRVQPTGERALSLSGHGTELLAWSTAARADKGELRGHRSYVYDVATAPDGRRLASASWDRTVRLWDRVTGELLRTDELAERLERLAWSPDGRWLAISAAAQVLLLDTAGDDQPLVLAGAPRGARMLWLAADELLLGGRGARDAATLQLVTLMKDGGVHSRAVPGHIEQDVQALAREPDGARLALAQAPDCSVLILSATEPTRVLERLELPAETQGAVSLAFVPGTGQLLIATRAGAVLRWEPGSGPAETLLPARSGVALHDLAVSPDGTRLALGTGEAGIPVHDLRDGHLVARLLGHQEYVHGLAFTPDGACLVSGSGDGTVRLWRTRTALDTAEAGVDLR